MPVERRSDAGQFRALIVKFQVKNIVEWNASVTGRDEVFGLTSLHKQEISGPRYFDVISVILHLNSLVSYNKNISPAL